MTSKNYKFEELSAYLDDEAADPEAIVRLIRENPEAADHLDRLKDASERVQVLPPPDVHPAFATRVMAAVAENQKARTWRWRRRAVTAIASTMALLLAISVGILTRTPESVHEPQAFNHEHDEELLLSLLETQDIDEALLLDEYMDDGSILTDPWNEPVLLEEEAHILEAIDLMLLAEQDLDSAIADLGQDETMMFAELLDSYYLGGNIT